ncbi:hypothetical protein ASPCAL02993 [Aspergillus calidoustus]|uniref:Uncharacterized protein n=1 Tax=Aspergillus calidoustus TaxID=454130 RepID=A0A0U4ZX27_ASPCI|nr:hypothetical protein ASPCAL02993 [Aspergillus calidoustus]
MPARMGHDDVIRVLIPHMSRANARSSRNMSGESALHLAMHSGKEMTVRLLAEWLPDGVYAVDCTWRTPLAVAVQIQPADAVEYLVDKGFNIATRDIEHRTLLYHAVDRGSEPIVRLQLERKCPVRKGKAGIVRLFLDHGKFAEHRDRDG